MPGDLVSHALHAQPPGKEIVRGDGKSGGADQERVPALQSVSQSMERTCRSAGALPLFLSMAPEQGNPRTQSPRNVVTGGGDGHSRASCSGIR